MKQESSASSPRPGNDYYSHVVNSLGSGVVVLDADGVVMLANPAARRYLGLDECALSVGERMEDIAGLGAFGDVVKEVMSRRESVSRREVVLEEADGPGRVLGVSASLLGGPVVFEGAILLFTDLTELRRLEREAETHRQLAEVGEMVGAVVHELRNPLMVVSGAAETILRDMEPGDSRRAKAETIIREVMDLNRTVDRFLGFARPFDLRPAPCSASQVLARALLLCERKAAKKGVRLTQEGVAEAIELRADADRIGQALANLIDNAVDAVGEGGEVCVHVRRDADAVVFDVLDNGPGIKLGPGQDLFKPFFSMKAGGTGLGLAIVKRLVAAHGGTASYSNRAEGGACFEIRLPIDG